MLRPSIIALACLALAITNAPQARAQKLQPAPTISTIPAGLTLPIEILHNLQAGIATPNQRIVGEIIQRVPISTDSYLPRGTKVFGTVVTSRAAASGQPAVLTLAFYKLKYHGVSVPIRTETLAVANVTNVGSTYSPAVYATAGDGGPSGWTTRLVGGDEVFRTGWSGPVANGKLQTVGFATFHGVYANPPAGATGTAAIPHSLGVFSTTAQGLYGFDDTSTLRSSAGTTTLTSARKLLVRNGDAFLLEVIP